MENYFSAEPLKVMISSRCTDKVSYKEGQRSLEAVRKDAKMALEETSFHGEEIFKVWIHEDEPGGHSWDECMDRAKHADIFIMFFNGNSGWSGTPEEKKVKLGICHAEFKEAYNQSHGKVRAIRFPFETADKITADGEFQAEMANKTINSAMVENGEEAIEATKHAAVAGMLQLAHTGIGLNATGSYYAGQALEWSRMDFARRRAETTGTLAKFLKGRSGFDDKMHPSENCVLFPIAGETVAFVCDSIPAAMSVAAARELVGQPFLTDHKTCQKLPSGTGGPVHVIGCQKGVSETQALRQLGFPDAIVVTAPFGVYVADDVQKIQMLFVPECRDASSTTNRIQRFLQWLDEQGESQLLARRAHSRRKIGDLIAAEYTA